MMTWDRNHTDSFQISLEAQCFLSHGIKLRKKVTLYCEFKVKNHLFIHSFNKHLSDLFVLVTMSALCPHETFIWVEETIINKEMKIIIMKYNKCQRNRVTLWKVSGRGYFIQSDQERPLWEGTISTQEKSIQGTEGHTHETQKKPIQG